MNYVVTDRDDKVIGTCLQGYVEASYGQLHKLLGEPIEIDDPYKVSTEWIIEWDDGVITTIYDYKDTTSYNSDGLSLKEFRALKSYQWHIGGKSEDVVARVQELIDQ